MNSGAAATVTPAMLKPPASTTIRIVWGPAASVAFSEMVVQFCHPPVLGTTADAVSVVPNRTCTAVASCGDATWSVIV